jgi:hypothetical protein
MVNPERIQASPRLPVIHRWGCLKPTAIIRPLSPEDTALQVSLPPWMISLLDHRLVGVQLRIAHLHRRFLEQDGRAPKHISSTL